VTNRTGDPLARRRRVDEVERPLVGALDRHDEADPFPSPVRERLARDFTEIGSM
jgi:hypothetical protein